MKPRGALAATLLATIGLFGCAEREAPPLPTYGNGLARRIEALEGQVPARVLPVLEGERARTLADLVEVLAAAAGTSMGRAAERDLVETGGEGAAALAGFALDVQRDARERARAAEALGGFATVEVAPEAALRAAEGADDEVVRAASVRAAGRLGRRWVVPRLILRLKYEKSDLVAAILAEVLADFGNPGGLPALAEVLRRGTLSDGPEFARALLDRRGGGGGAEEGIEGLSRALEALERAWREEGAQPDSAGISPSSELEWLRRVAALGAPSLRTVDDARFVLARGGLEALHPLLLGLDDPDPFVRIRSMEVLGWHGQAAAAAVPRLLELRLDPSHRTEPLLALGRIGERSATPALVEAIDDAEPDVRVAALRALVEVADPAARGALRAALEASDAVGRGAEEALFAAWGLVRLDDLSAVGHLVRIAASAPDRVERRARIQALEEASRRVREAGGDDGGFAQAASEEERSAAVRRWLELHGTSPSPAK